MSRRRWSALVLGSVLVLGACQPQDDDAPVEEGDLETPAEDPVDEEPDDAGGDVTGPDDDAADPAA